jgi:hypothetical protein
MVGFAFGGEEPAGPEWDGFAPAAAVVPEVSVVREGGQSHLIMVVPPGSDGAATLALLSTLERPGPVTDAGETDETIEARPPPQTAWAGSTGGRRSGELESGTGAFGGGASPDAARPFRRGGTLAQRPPRVVGVRMAGAGTFVSASPELSWLVAAMSISTRWRGQPTQFDPEQDRRLGEGCLPAPGPLEHELVVTDAPQRLATLVAGLLLASPQLGRFPRSTPGHPVSGTTSARILAWPPFIHCRRRRRAHAKRCASSQGREIGAAGMPAGSDGPMVPVITVRHRVALRPLAGRDAVATPGVGSSPTASRRRTHETRLKLRPILGVLT